MGFGCERGISPFRPERISNTVAVRSGPSGAPMAAGRAASGGRSKEGTGDRRAQNAIHCLGSCRSRVTGNQLWNLASAHLHLTCSEKRWEAVSPLR
jgi:hypothetical protein